ncbi:hypothetical protein NHX12_010346 [Muraenolepis orangiensis]|uniref:Uncharacterized protein n=1 Tax=Muraenolepis orangiensis TaxID=630683 RepID=A0A9Q0DL03_9TELE|nr:hypothetical protein NHX12_010346 [Muraenolepis orangiensis]
MATAGLTLGCSGEDLRSGEMRQGLGRGYGGPYGGPPLVTNPAHSALLVHAGILPGVVGENAWKEERQK